MVEMNSTFFLILKSLLAIFMACQCCSYNPLGPENIPNSFRYGRKVFPGFKIRGKVVISETQCFDECLRTPACASINLKTNRTNSNLDWCVINYKSMTDTSELKTRENVTYFHVNSTFLSKVSASVIKEARKYICVNVQSFFVQYCHLGQV